MLLREQFPSVLESKTIGSERLIKRFDQALTVLNTSLLTGSIRNTDLKDVKRWCSDVASDIWGEKVSDVHFNNYKHAQLPRDLVDFYYAIMIHGIHSLTSVDKKLQKTKLVHPMIDSMRAVTKELMPLASAIDSLKTAVVKGRAPSTKAPEPENPNKVVKTCACCDRAIAVVGGTMAHHGYERPGNGWQTQSCAGVRFPPIEVSSAGLKWLIENQEEALKHTIKLREEKGSLEKLHIRIAGEPATITRESSRWKSAFQRYEAQLDHDIASIPHELERLRKRLADWKPEVVSAKEDDSPSP